MWRDEAFRPGKGWHVDEACLLPTSGGEPLWRVTRQPRDISICTPVGPQNVAAGGSREFTQRDAVLSPECKRIESHG
jgi:hypothetical protein